MAHAEWAFSRFGMVAFSWLNTREHFEEWLRRFSQSEKMKAFDPKIVLQILHSLFKGF